MITSNALELGLLLLAYLGVGIWIWTIRGPEARGARRTGSLMGVLLGVIGAASLTAESLAGLRPPFNVLVPASEMAAMVVLFGAAATVTFRRSRRMALALSAAVWSAVLGTSLICAYGFLLQVTVLQQRGLGSLGNTAESAIEHLMIAPIVAVAATAVAIVATLLRTSSQPRVRLALALLDILALTGGVSLLVLAASLARPERPPFVLTGMLLAAAALAGAPALFRIDAQARP
jgi:hypothetical protein